jgi:hypothetical protein
MAAKSDAETIAALTARVKELEAKLQAVGPRRERIAQMSSEVVDSNPYSRLMALKRMGIVDNYEVIATSLFFWFPLLFFHSSIDLALPEHSSIHGPDCRRRRRGLGGSRNADSLRHRQIDSI